MICISTQSKQYQWIIIIQFIEYQLSFKLCDQQILAGYASNFLFISLSEINKKSDTIFKDMEILISIMYNPEDIVLIFITYTQNQ